MERGRHLTLIRFKLRVSEVWLLFRVMNVCQLQVSRW